MSDALGDTLDDLPPSPTLVALTLRDAEVCLTVDEIVDRAYLSESTVRTALSRLENEGILRSRRHPEDTRRRSYTVYANTA